MQQFLVTEIINCIEVYHFNLYNIHMYTRTIFFIWCYVCCNRTFCLWDYIIVYQGLGLLGLHIVYVSVVICSKVKSWQVEQNAV